MKLRMFGVLLLLVFGVIGCALLQEAPPIAIPASRLSCTQNPEMVDGDLSTVGTFAAKGSIKKEFVRNLRYASRQYQRRVIGSLKTETLIKLDAPTYIKYIEVYPASTIPNFALDATAEEKSPKWMLSFTAVEDKRSQRVEGTLPVKFQIERIVLYLRLTANALEDSDNVSHGNEIGELRIPLKGASIREVKFYGR
ncbi:hypothetical protein F4X88_03765 [Candidatus Poribacteria bacterium]|nr:hypothetical protein [Candidatus Poribacteria bacterium]MXV82187.1 hypothetical protein [Candidatus Poribacteria bacterium]MYA55392.1 hypothetical protein [Candidatus Poribacteria bacterium]